MGTVHIGFSNRVFSPVGSRIFGKKKVNPKNWGVTPNTLWTLKNFPLTCSNSHSDHQSEESLVAQNHYSQMS